MKYVEGIREDSSVNGSMATIQTVKLKTEDGEKNIEENKNMPAQIISDDECEAEAVELKHNQQEKFFYDQKICLGF